MLKAACGLSSCIVSQGFWGMCELKGKLSVTSPAQIKDVITQSGALLGVVNICELEDLLDQVTFIGFL